MPQARNRAQLEALLLPSIKGTVESTLSEIVTTNKEKIESIVYKTPDSDNSYYERTNQFAEAWDYEMANTIGTRVSGEFKYFPEKMNYVAEMAQHGSPIGFDMEQWGDAREYLADIIYEGQSSTTFGRGHWTRKRDAFTALTKTVGTIKFNQWFMSGALKAGLTLIKKK